MNYQGLMEITKIENIADDVYEMTLKGEGAKLEDRCLFQIMMKIPL